MRVAIPTRSVLLAAAIFAAGWSTPAAATVELASRSVVERPPLLSAPFLAAPAGGIPQGANAPVREDMRVAQADCSAAAAEAAADSGGQVLSVSSREEGGRTVCVVTVLVPGADGGRPRKQTITIPQ